jgi:hypothetical protein
MAIRNSLAPDETRRSLRRDVLLMALNCFANARNDADQDDAAIDGGTPAF